MTPKDENLLWQRLDRELPPPERQPFLHRWGWIILFLTTLLLILGITSAPVVAHEWYDRKCCSTRDCAPIPAVIVRTIPRGYLLTIQPGQHPMVKVQQLFFVPYDDPRLRVSQDTEFHACIAHYDQRLLCLYAPVNGS